MATELTILLILYAVVAAVAHPSCLNNPGPISHTEPLSFCTMYSNYSCCSVNDDMVHQNTFDQMSATLPSDVWKKCSVHAKNLLCQNCSPYAAHVFDSKYSGLKRYFPGLCKDYCKNFYSDCRQILKYFSRPQREYSRYRASIRKKTKTSNPNGFCKYIAPPDNDYCYPDIVTSDIMSGKNTIVQSNEKGCICVREVASQLRLPVFAVHAGDGTNRLFVGELSGKILSLLPGQSQEEMQVFMDIEHLVYTGSDSNVFYERGMIGMAFHPNFTSNGLFYVSYSKETAEKESADHVTRLSEFSVSIDNPNKGNVSSERVLLDIKHPFTTHSGGDTFFVDGYLYHTVGDGGNIGDPYYLSQNKSVFNGKILRIDVNTKSPGKEYGIPEDNPFSDGVEGLPEIYTLGWRHPWKCGVDPGDRKTKEGRGDIICGDVGHNHFEELNLIVKGGNYGWSGFEGNNCFKRKGKYCEVVAKEENLQEPIWIYDHKTGKCVIGGHFYRGCSSPSLNGYYIYGDREHAALYKIKFDKSTEEWKNKLLPTCGPDICTFPNQSLYYGKINSFGQDEKGEIYFLTLNSSEPVLTAPLGILYQIIDPASSKSPESCD